VIETVREKVSCRVCEKITQPPAPFHVTPRGMFGPHFLANLAFQKYGLHQPLNSQRDRLEAEGIPLSLSTLADQIGAISVAVKPLFALIEAHVLAAERLHGDDTTVPRLAKYKTDIARMWNYVRDDRPFGGPAPPAVVFYYSRDRKGEHPRTHLAHYTGILQVDRFAGFNDMFKSGWADKPMTRANCWAHSRRKLFELADIDTQLKRRKRDAKLIISPLALEAVQRIDVIFDIEREITGSPADVRLAVRKERVAPLVADLEIWMREQLKTLSKHDPVAKAMRYMFNDWPGFIAFLDDGRICLTNNGAERGLRGIARGRKAWLFVGSDRGGERAAAMYTLMETCRLNEVDPLAWLTDVLARIADLPQGQLDELLPWHWKALQQADTLEMAA
jgi:transposase